MQYRQFGSTDLRVSEIGFGAWAIGGPANVGGIAIGWGPSDDEVSVRAMHAALSAGINFFDTADFYGLGHSEALIGSTIGNRKDIIIATKVGQRVGDDGKIMVDYSREHVLAACEKSLNRLKRDYIDYYQLHVARLAHLQNGECIAAMEQLQQEGKIRHWGISLNTFAPEPEAHWMLEHNKGKGFQLVLNLINQISVPLLEQAAQNGYGIIARMPLQFGMLSGHIKPDTVFDAGDHRAYRLTPAIIGAALQILETHVSPVAMRYGVSLSSLALSFILGFSAVSTVIPGIRTPRHVELNTSGIVPLSAEDHQLLQSHYQLYWSALLSDIQKQG